MIQYRIVTLISFANKHFTPECWHLYPHCIPIATCVANFEVTQVTLQDFLLFTFSPSFLHLRKYGEHNSKTTQDNKDHPQIKSTYWMSKNSLTQVLITSF